MSKALLAILLFGACLDQSEDANAPSDDELADLDQWADASGGKADLPNTFGEAVAWVKDFYTNRMSAIWNNQEHPATPAAALSRIRGMTNGSDPSGLLFTATVRRLHAGVIDHSEIDITMPNKQVIRLVGDPKGAGAFVDKALFADALSPPLCLTWTELQTAVTTSYQPGHYAVDFVCHVITEKVLRALHIGSRPFSSQIKTYDTARWVWGPILPSGNSAKPSDWAESRACH